MALLPLASLPLPSAVKFAHRTIHSRQPHPAIPSSVADNSRRFYPNPPDATPFDLFTLRVNGCTLPGFRFIRKTNEKQMLMFIDSACSNNGTAEARAGYGVVFTCLDWFAPISDPLEDDGHPQTSNRAELRAAIAALSLRFWPGEGFNNIILASDSEYVVKGVSEWLNFWLIPRKLNEADLYAKKGAAQVERMKGPVEDIMIMERMPGELYVRNGLRKNTASK